MSNGDFWDGAGLEPKPLLDCSGFKPGRFLEGQGLEKNHLLFKIDGEEYVDRESYFCCRQKRGIGKPTS